MKDETQKALADLFSKAWDWFVDGSTEELSAVLEDSPLVAHVIATQEDVDNSIAPEGIEEGDTFYVLSELGKEAWDYAKKSV